MSGIANTVSRAITVEVSTDAMMDFLTFRFLSLGSIVNDARIYAACVRGRQPFSLFWPD